MGHPNLDPILDLSRATIFYDGVSSNPPLNHPEGIAVASDGSVWCGGIAGELFRIAPDGSQMRLVASSGGCILGVAVDPNDNVYVCDQANRSVFKFDARTRMLRRFSRLIDGPDMVTPNGLAIDVRRNFIYVSDSNVEGTPGQGIYRLDLDSGEGALWYEGPLNFANGIAVDPTGRQMYVAESFGHRVIALPILPGGDAGEPDVVWGDTDVVVDGISLDAAGNLYVCCYRPDRIVRINPDGQVATLIEDPNHNLLKNPTNCAFRGDLMFTANLGGCHITQIDLS